MKKENPSEVLKKLIKNRRITSNKLRGRLGVSYITLLKYINNPHKIPHIKKIHMARALKIPIETLNEICGGKKGFLEVIKILLHEAA